MAVIDELMIALGVDTDGPSFARANSAISGLVQQGVNLSAAIASAVTAMFGIAKVTADYADEAHDAAVAVGLDAQALLELRWAAERATGSAEGLEAALRVVSRTTQDAIDGNETAAAAFRKVGVSVDMLRGKRPDEVLALIADGMKGLPTATERTAVAMDLLGRSGASLVPLLAEGADGMAALRRRARELGVEVSKVDEEAAGEFNDTLDDLTTIGGGLVRRIGTGLIPVFTRWGKAIVDLWDRNRDLITQRLDKWVDGLASALSLLEGPLGVVVGLFLTLGAARTAQTIMDLASAVPVLGKAFMAAKAGLVGFGLPLLGIALALAAIEDLVVFERGGDSLTERLLNWLGADDETIEKMRLLTKHVKDMFGAFERLIRVGAGMALLPFDAAAAVRIAEGEAFIGDPFEKMGDQGQRFGRFSQRIDAIRSDFDRTFAPAETFDFGPQNMAATVPISIAINQTVNGGDPIEVQRATREGIREAMGQYPAAR